MNAALNPLIPELNGNGQVLAQVNGCLGVITLNRAQALNALSLPMIRDITRLLQHWQGEAAIEAVLVLGQQREGKAPAFCAGGDIRFFHQAALARDPQLMQFFAEEYALNHLIHHYPKPYLALMDGIVMGGGMGISQGARLRVVNEGSKLAMPETHIGLFPDVGGGYFLGQCPGSTGEWLALTGQVLGAGDAIALGLADVFVPQAVWPQLVQALLNEAQSSAEHVVATVMARSELAPEALFEAEQTRIDACFSQPNLLAVLAAVRADGSDWAQAALVKLESASPTALATSLELVRRGRHLSLADELRQELNLVHWCFASALAGGHSDTVEGIRALAVDKDHAPRWQPARVEALPADLIERAFASPWSSAGHPLASLDSA